MSGLRTGWRVAAVAVLLAALGCGGSGKRFPVEGVVLMGGKPVDGATVTFVPEGEGQPANGFTDSNGVFKLSTNNITGAFAGNYKVTISKIKAIDPPKTTAPPPRSGEAGGSPPPGYQDPTQLYLQTMKPGAGGSTSVVPKNELPDRYNNAQTSQLTCKVPADGQVRFELHK
jgi:hypothetical protein